jgi:hypothetical protein
MENFPHRDARGSKGSTSAGARLCYLTTERDPCRTIHQSWRAHRDRPRNSPTLLCGIAPHHSGPAQRQGTAIDCILSLPHYYPYNYHGHSWSGSMFGHPLITRAHKTGVLMKACARSQRGFMLLEVLISCALLAIAAFGLLAFTARSLRLLQHVGRIQAPGCEFPTCSSHSQSSTCACGPHEAVVIW